MMDLVDFLRQRLDEDEQVALDAPGLGRWEVQGYHVHDPSLPKSVGPVASHAIGYANHIARHDPARVLREVEARRQLVREISVLTEFDWGEPDGSMRSEYVEAFRRVLRLLALPYSAHPDYRPEWKP